MKKVEKYAKIYLKNLFETTNKETYKY